ncbi:MAG: DUF4922 domain-containing protein, partial [Bacteroidetes bacterium]|nr:DUF4922 domain-containing protein [Bacteroidota bacterium]
MKPDATALRRVTVTPKELAPFGGVADSWADLAHALFVQQKHTWEMLRAGYASLESVQTRHFQVDGCEVLIQFNPGRLTSSAANVDEQSIRERRCFLCVHNLPEGQRGLVYGERYILLCNPFPILPQHFTIPRIDHVPQRLDNEIGVFLNLTRDLAPRFSTFYNGARCGASAPDHLHFQAGTRMHMPLESEYTRLREERGTVMVSTDTHRAVAIEGGGRRFLALEGRDPDALRQSLQRYLFALQELKGETDEPMVNLIAWYDTLTWYVLVFPRVQHRPSFFFAEGDARLLISPAAVDLGGVSVTP